VRNRNSQSRSKCHSGKARVVFNWNIIKAPHSIVDYVVINELCHILHPNHSKAFWQEAEKHDNAYTELRSWPKQKAEAKLT
jgi:predicted metal-dependent hydrolase